LKAKQGVYQIKDLLQQAMLPEIEHWQSADGGQLMIMISRFSPSAFDRRIVTASSPPSSPRPAATAHTRRSRCTLPAQPTSCQAPKPLLLSLCALGTTFYVLIECRFPSPNHPGKLLTWSSTDAVSVHLDWLFFSYVHIFCFCFCVFFFLALLIDKRHNPPVLQHYNERIHLLNNE
jgi:hypothetical protein